MNSDENYSRSTYEPRRAQMARPRSSTTFSCCTWYSSVCRSATRKNNSIPCSNAHTTPISRTRQSCRVCRQRAKSYEANCQDYSNNSNTISICMKTPRTSWKNISSRPCTSRFCRVHCIRRRLCWPKSQNQKIPSICLAALWPNRVNNNNNNNNCKRRTNQHSWCPVNHRNQKPNSSTIPCLREGTRQSFLFRPHWSK